MFPLSLAVFSLDEGLWNLKSIPNILLKLREKAQPVSTENNEIMKLLVDVVYLGLSEYCTLPSSPLVTLFLGEGAGKTNVFSSSFVSKHHVLREVVYYCRLKLAHHMAAVPKFMSVEQLKTKSLKRLE